jgi:hypothetical protein
MYNACMGFFDRFRRKPTAAPAALPPKTSPLATAEPKTPVHATIESFVVVDGVGSLVLYDGTSLRFGGSACKGFEPVVGTRVLVTEAKHQWGAWRAVSVTLDDATYTDLLAARDHALGAKPNTAESAVAVAQTLGAITVVLRDKLPPDSELRTWTARASGNGVVFSVGRGLELAVHGRSLLVYPGRVPYPGEDEKLGRSFIGLGTGMPGTWRLHRAALHSVPDFWADTGPARDISRAVKQLAPLASGVILHRALEHYVEIEEFVEDFDDLSSDDRPFEAWLHFTKPSGRDGVLTQGMDAFGLPDVCGDDHDAVHAAVARMIFENVTLANDETIEHDGVTYTVRDHGDWLALER